MVSLFVCKKKNTVLIKSSIFVTKRLVGAIWCLNVTVLFTFAKPYLNFVYHGICRICPVILVLRGSSCFFVAVFLVACLYYETALADISTKALRENIQLSIYKMLGIHSRIFVLFYKKKITSKY